MGRTCEEPDEIELNAMGVELNGSLGMQGGTLQGGLSVFGVEHKVHDRLSVFGVEHKIPGLLPKSRASVKHGSSFRVGILFDFVRRPGTTRAEGPHGAHVRAGSQAKS